ncbi:hypothetical protein EN766_01345 [Mesorhizobium sp. M2A.F.Ca.ET.046.02.1.1]|nr:hypothetical protein EN766_01345 [Mesorhizobium sp. M2A.F.Ca.ET.046.02.1.1]
MINATKEDNMSGTRRADLSKGIACESPTGVTGVDTRSSPGTGQRPSIEEQMDSTSMFAHALIACARGNRRSDVDGYRLSRAALPMSWKR